MKLFTALLFLILAVSLARIMLFSFRAQSPADYATTGPAFSLTEQFNGDILSEGVIYGPTGRVTSSFVAQMRGEWEGQTGTLTEEFTYSNGNTQSRKWFLTLQDANNFTATASDVVGTAVGTVSGSTVKMTYTIILPPESGGHKLHVTDWLYLTGNGTIMNRSEMRKFGIKLAELVATMRPSPGAN